ncbi:hypothetical protein B566_EDAN007628 [Ephemera danica]|nr:hypothetical protein B566_EDAN007628 [Ephemera danica]
MRAEEYGKRFLPENVRFWEAGVRVWRQQLTSRPIRRALFLVLAWGLVASLLFMLVGRDVGGLGPVALPRVGWAAGGSGAVNGRLLLQQPPPPVTDGSTTENLLELEPSVDRSPSRSEDLIVKDVQQRLPSLPIAYWNQNKNKAGIIVYYHHPM